MNKDNERLAEDLEIMESWFMSMGLRGEVMPIDPDVLDRVIDHFGGNLEISPEGEQKLSKYGLKEVRQGMKEVWGGERLDSFNSFLSSWIAQYNKSHNRRLPESTDTFTGEAGLGMRRFFLEFTQLAYGLIDQDTFKQRTDAALLNGKLWVERKDGERVSLTNSASPVEPKKVLEIAPGFMVDFWKWLQSSSNE